MLNEIFDDGHTDRQEGDIKVCLLILGTHCSLGSSSSVDKLCFALGASRLMKCLTPIPDGSIMLTCKYLLSENG